MSFIVVVLSLQRGEFMKNKKLKTIAYYRSADVNKDWNFKMQFEDFCKRHEELDVQSYCIDSVRNGIFNSICIRQILQECMEGKCKAIVINSLLTISNDIEEIFYFIVLLKRFKVKLYCQKKEPELMKYMDRKYKALMKEFEERKRSEK